MKDLQVIQNYLKFQELFKDTMGSNSRVALLENQKPVSHYLLCQVNPLISTNTERIRRVKILLDGIKKAGIPALYSPLDSFSHDNQVYFLYEYIKGKTLEQVIEDATQKGRSISFDLILSIATTIADIIESGSAIIISGEKSFHGFLTPDNILFHYDGKIYLKNYGIFPYMDKSGSLFSEMESRYGNWLTPEFVRKEKLVAQTDMYSLGCVIYRMMTGKFFELNAGEDFENKVSLLNLKSFIPSNDKNLHSNLINFFKKTLHPDPLKRFLTIKEFKDYISSYFHIEELSSITFNIAYFMNSIYGEAMEKEEKYLQDELAYILPSPKKEEPTAKESEISSEMKAKSTAGKSKVEKDDELVSALLGSLDKEKKSGSKIWIAIVVFLVVVGVALYLYLNQVKKTKLLEQASLEAQRQIALKEKEKQQEIAVQKEREKQIQDELIRIQEEQEKVKKDKEQADKFAELNKKQLELMKEKEKIRLEAEERQKQEEAQKQREAEAVVEKQKQEEIKKAEIIQEQKNREEEAQKVQPGDVVPYGELDVKPTKISGAEPSQYLQSNPFWSKKLRMNQEVKGKFFLTYIIKISETGTVENITITGKAPNDLKDMMREVLSNWKFKPGEKKGVKVKVFLSPQTIGFQF